MTFKVNGSIFRVTGVGVRILPTTCLKLVEIVLLPIVTERVLVIGVCLRHTRGVNYWVRGAGIPGPTMTMRKGRARV